MWSPARDLRETAGQMIIYPTVDEARLIFASGKWLEIYLTIGAGIEQTVHPIERCIEMLLEKREEMRKQTDDEKVLVFSRRDLSILRYATVHMDRYAVAREKPPQRKFPKGAKKK